MSVFVKDQWQEWAREWGLAHHPEQAWLKGAERIVGERQGLLLVVERVQHESSALSVRVSFPRVSDLQRLRQALIDDPTLDTLPGKGAARRKLVVEDGSKKVIHIGQPPEFVLTGDSLLWRRTFALRIPKPADLTSWVDTLIQAIARATPAFDGRCESCSTGTVRQYVMVDGLPAMMCASCLQRLRAEGEMAERTYEMKETRHLAGMTLALPALVVGALVWAGIAVLTERSFALLGIGMGALVAWCYRLGAGRVDLAGRLIAGGLTIASVVLGQVLLYAWWFAQERPDVGFDLGLGWFAYLRSWSNLPGQEAMALLFGVAGAWVATQVLARPKLAPTISTGEEQRKAA